MATTYELIASATLGSAAAGITFSSIPATYDDLALVISARSAKADFIDQLFHIINNDNTLAITARILQGYNGSASSSTQVGGGGTNQVNLGWISAASATANTFSSHEIYFPNYAGSANKSYTGTGVSEHNNANNAVINARAFLCPTTAAISQIKIYGQSGNLVTGSSAYLYGITKS